ncbi:MAG: hypothetical protein A2X42_04190 [Candidatus Margulisbacteria bacterium GWF2_38_17]|nr:MAG: hypothetical protein A2X42_04190 [Candidatus Margulisbacteria bacterium GWF2_38_17]
MKTKSIIYRTLAAESEEDKRLVYNLRYRAYTDCSAIEPNTEQLFYDVYDMQHNCQSYLILKKGNPIGSIRECIYLPSRKEYNEIPLFHVFKDVVEEQIGLDKKLIEVNRFIILPEYQKKEYLPKIELFKQIFRSAINFDISHILVCVREEHKNFYCKTMLFQQLSDSRPYPGLKFRTVMLSLDFKNNYNLYKNDKNNPMFHSLSILVDKIVYD